MAVSAKTKNPKVGQTTTNILKSISGGKILPLTDLPGNGISSCIKDLYDYKLVKKCRVCKNNLLISSFNKNKTKRDGYRFECRSCCKVFYYNNRDRFL